MIVIKTLQIDEDSQSCQGGDDDGRELLNSKARNFI